MVSAINKPRTVTPVVPSNPMDGNTDRDPAHTHRLARDFARQQRHPDPRPQTPAPRPCPTPDENPAKVLGGRIDVFAT